MRVRRRATFFVLALALIFQAAFVGQAESQTSAPLSASQVADPAALFHHVFTLVNAAYYDPDFNNQKWERWEHKYDGKLRTMDDARKAIETMLASLGDRYTRYLDPSAFDNEKMQIASKLYGIGAQLGLNQLHKLIVVAPMPDTPSSRAGLMPQDEILQIDGKSTDGITVEQASKRIRGDIGTSVRLTIRRQETEKDYTLVRDEIPIRSVHAVKMLTNDIGYIQLSTFMSERASLEVREALGKLSPARGLILDLRNNQGGLVSNAMDICGLFLDGDVDLGSIVVSTIDRTGKMQSSRCKGLPVSHQPIVILINGDSASAAEITSGALHDHKRAQLVGQKSFGKGLVQSITRLEDGSGINITIARYVTPNLTDIHKKGIVPDVDVELTADDYQKGRGPWFIYKAKDPANPEPEPLSDLKDIQLTKAVQVLKGNMDSASAPIQIRLNPIPGDNGVGLGMGMRQ